MASAVDHVALRAKLANPFTPEQKADVHEALTTLEHVKAAHKRAKMAGIDVSDSEKIAQEAEAKLRALKGVYFPHG